MSKCLNRMEHIFISSSVATEGTSVLLHQVKIPWLTTRMSTISTQWLGSWSCTSEDWRTPSSQRNASWTSSPPSVSHTQQKYVKPVSGDSSKGRKHTLHWVRNSVLLTKRKACGAAHGSNLNTKALWLMLNREPVGRGECDSHYAAVCEFTTETFSRCFYSNSLITRGTSGVWWKTEGGIY